MRRIWVKQIFRQLLAAVVMFSLILPGNLWAKRKGAQVQITKLDGHVVEGDLLRVKENSLLLMTSASKTGITIDIKEVDNIEIKKRKKGAGKGTLIGAGICFLVGAVYGGASLADVIDGGSTLGGRILLGGIMGALFAYPGALIGGAIGSSIPGRDYKVVETIDVKRTHPDEMKHILKKLKKKARFKN